MKILKLAVSNTAPNVRDCAWLKPVGDGFMLYALEGGTWKPLKVANDGGTPAIADDKPATILTVTNISKLSNKQCDALNVGDQVIKKTGNQMHLYTVTYKEDKQGLCLCYFDAENVETIPYDWNDTTKKWEVGTPTYTSIAAST